MWQSLGKVVSNQAVVRATDNLGAAKTNSFQVYSVTVQQIPGQSGKIYIGTSDMDTSTLVGVIYILAIPTTNSLPAWQDSVVNAVGGHDVSQLYIKSELAAEGALVSVSIQ